MIWSPLLSFTVTQAEHQICKFSFFIGVKRFTCPLGILFRTNWAICSAPTSVQLVMASCIGSDTTALVTKFITRLHSSTTRFVKDCMLWVRSLTPSSWSLNLASICSWTQGGQGTLYSLVNCLKSKRYKPERGFWNLWIFSNCAKGHVCSWWFTASCYVQEWSKVYPWRITWRQWWGNRWTFCTTWYPCWKCCNRWWNGWPSGTRQPEWIKTCHDLENHFTQRQWEKYGEIGEVHLVIDRYITLVHH